MLRPLHALVVLLAPRVGEANSVAPAQGGGLEASSIGFNLPCHLKSGAAYVQFADPICSSTEGPPIFLVAPSLGYDWELFQQATQ